MDKRIGTSVSKAAKLLGSGQLVAIPTETVYGLAANALDVKAVQSIFNVKNRPVFNPLIVHVKSVNEFYKYAKNVPVQCLDLANALSPGPITFVLSKKDIVPDHTTGGGNSVALRIPNHPLTLALLNQLDFPLAAPSANPSNYISPVTALHVLEQLGGKIPYILDGGDCQVGIESTVVCFEEDTTIILRLGGQDIAAIEQIVGKVELRINQASNPQSPGQLKSHYAPKTPFLLGGIQELIKINPNKRIGVIAFGANFQSQSEVSRTYNLSSQGSTSEAASNIFKALREMDSSQLDLIIAAPIPNEGLGAAVNDRLERAAAVS